MQLALNVSNRDIKLTALRGDTLVKWATAPLPPGAVKDGRVLGPETVAGAIGSLFQTLQLPHLPVNVCLSGMSFTYRLLNLPAIKSTALREAVERATQKEIHVPLAELYLDWQVVKSGPAGIQVFVLGVPRIQIDSLLKTLKLAKLKVAGMDLKSLALTRAAGMSDGLIVDFEPDFFNIIVLSQGIPLVLHTFNPRNRASLEDNVHQLIEELDRTIDFYNLTHQERPFLPNSPVLFTGELAGGAALDLIKRHSAHPACLLNTPFKLPADFPLSAFAGTIGLLTKKAKTGAQGMIDLDPLRGKRRVATHQPSILRYKTPAALAAAFLLIAALMAVRNQAAAQTVVLQSELDNLTRGVMLHNLSLSQADQTRARIAGLKAETSAWQKERQTLAGNTSLSVIIDTITEALPRGARYTQIVSTAGEVAIEASVEASAEASAGASAREDVFSYARRLETTGLFAGVRIDSLEDTPQSGADANSRVKFKIVLER
jgi:hypothetical protein